MTTSNLPFTQSLKPHRFCKPGRFLSNFPPIIIIVPIFQPSNLPLFHSSILPFFHSSILPFFHSSNLPFFHSSNLPFFHPSILPSFHFSILPSFHFSILPFFHCRIVELSNYQIVSSSILPFLLKPNRCGLSNLKIPEAEIGGFEGIKFYNIRTYTWDGGIKGNRNLKGIYNEVVVFN